MLRKDLVGMALVASGAALSATAVLPLVLAGFFVIGVGLPVLAEAAATLLQRRTANAVMGRVAAGYEMISSVPTTASIAVGALLVGVLPFEVVLLVVAVGCATATLLLAVGIVVKPMTQGVRCISTHFSDRR